MFNLPTDKFLVKPWLGGSVGNRVFYHLNDMITRFISNCFMFFFSRNSEFCEGQPSSKHLFSLLRKKKNDTLSTQLHFFEIDSAIKTSR